jgi:hypothetical protein
MESVLVALRAFLDFGDAVNITMFEPSCKVAEEKGIKHMY